MFELRKILSPSWISWKPCSATYSPGAAGGKIVWRVKINLKRLYFSRLLNSFFRFLRKHLVSNTHTIAVSKTLTWTENLEPVCSKSYSFSWLGLDLRPSKRQMVKCIVQHKIFWEAFCEIFSTIRFLFLLYVSIRQPFFLPCIGYFVREHSC